MESARKKAATVVASVARRPGAVIVVAGDRRAAVSVVNSATLFAVLPFGSSKLHLVPSLPDTIPSAGQTVARVVSFEYSHHLSVEVTR